MRSLRTARVSLGLLALAAASIGLPAALAPQTFYDDFPFFTSWVELLPPYNEHLVTDVGGLYLGFTVLFAWAAWRTEPTLVRAASAAWLLVASIHLAFHAHHLQGFGTADAIGELASLTALFVPALLAIWATTPPLPEGPTRRSP
jgi:hypothetical protein